MATKKLQTFVLEHPETESVAYANNYQAHREGISCDESTKIYDQWTSYEQDLNRDRYRGPVIAAEAVGRFFPSARHSALILDVACGTGFVAEELHKLGFRRLHGLDPSAGLLKKAKEKEVYQQLFCSYLDHQSLPIENDTYDCAVIAGGMGEGHIPCVGLLELARIVKPGGLVCIVMREEYLEHVQEYRGQLEIHMKKMEASGAWKLLSRTLVPNYSFNNTGVVFCFQVC